MNMLRSVLYIFLINLALAPSGFAQLMPPAQPARFQSPVSNNEEGFMTMSMEHEGLIMVHDIGKYQRDQKEWEMVVLDTALIPAWSAKFTLENELGFIGYEYKPGYFFMLFTKSTPDNFKGTILKVNLATRTWSLDKIDVQLSLNISHYTVAGLNSIIGGTVGTQPAIAIYQHETGRTRILPGFFLTDADLLDIKPNHNNTFSLLQLQKSGREKTLVYRAYDPEGNLLVEDRFRVDAEVSILSALTSTLRNDEVMISGAYSYGTNKLASGFFTAMVNPFDVQPLTYTDFTVLDHFLDYMPDNKSSRIVQKASQRKTYGRIPDYRMAVNLHRVDDHPFGFILFGESYVPPVQPANNFMTNPYTMRGLGYGFPYYWGFPSMRYYGYDPFMQQPMAQAEYRMVSTFAIAFDHTGNRLWDQSLPYDDLRTHSSTQVADVVVSPTDAAFIYTDEGGIHFSRSTGNQEKKSTGETPLRLAPDEELRTEGNAGHTVRWWYDRKLFIFGYQQLRDLKNPEDVHRKRVFFINKVSLD